MIDCPNVSLRWGVKGGHSLLFIGSCREVILNGTFKETPLESRCRVAAGGVPDPYG